MRYTQALAARAQAWLDRPLTAGPEGRRSAEGLLELATVWAAIQGLPLPECLRQCQYLERAAAIRSYLTEFSRLQTPELMSDSQYQFAPAYQNESISDERYAKKVTADNLTDEDAAFLIPKGYGHVIIERKAAGAVAQTPAAGQDADEPEATEREQELQAEVDQANRKMADQTESYNTAYCQVSDALTAEQSAHTTTTDALASEKQAHEATKSQLSEVQQQLAEAQATIATLTAPKASKKAASAADSTSTDGAAA